MKKCFYGRSLLTSVIKSYQRRVCSRGLERVHGNASSIGLGWLLLQDLTVVKKTNLEFQRECETNLMRCSTACSLFCFLLLRGRSPERDAEIQGERVMLRAYCRAIPRRPLHELH
jgi:hypothetical protein